jgi:hypothetical protein
MKLFSNPMTMKSAPPGGIFGSSNYNNTSDNIAAGLASLAAPADTSNGDFNEQGKMNIHQTIRQCLETELETTTYTIRGDLQQMSRNMTNGTKLMLSEHSKTVANKMADVIDSVDMRVKVAFDCYDEVTKESTAKVEVLQQQVDSMERALNISKRDYDYALAKLMGEMGDKQEQQRIIFDEQTAKRQAEIKENFSEIQRAVMAMRETDRREVFDLVKEAHDTSQRLLLDHHDQVSTMHKEFDKRMSRFQSDLKAQNDRSQATLMELLQQTVSKTEENQATILRQQKDMVEQLTQFMHKQDTARAADKAEILSLAGVTKEAAKQLHENSKENLVFVQEEVVDLRKKLFLQEQANYDMKKEYSRLLQKQAGPVLMGDSSSAAAAAVTAGGRPFSPTDDFHQERSRSPTAGTYRGAREPPAHHLNRAASPVGSPAAAATTTTTTTTTLGGGGYASPGTYSSSSPHGGSSTLGYNPDTGMHDYGSLKFGKSPTMSFPAQLSSSSRSNPAQQETKDSTGSSNNRHSPQPLGRMVGSPSSSGFTSYNSKPSAAMAAPKPYFTHAKADKPVAEGLVSNSPYIMSMPKQQSTALRDGW